MLLLLLLGTAAYAALWWYPAKAAGELMEPSSAEFAGAAQAYRDVIEAYPETLEEETLVEQTSAELQAAAVARSALTVAQDQLEERKTVSIPIIKSRPPLGLAISTRQRMVDFSIGALELIGDLEVVTRYVSELAPLLPKVADLREAIGIPSSPEEVDAALEAARPLATQLTADVEALTPPVELGSAHEALKAIVGRTASDLNELDGVTGRGAGPILQSLSEEVIRQLDTFRDTILGAPAEALKAGLAARMRELDRQVERITDALRELRDDDGLPVTVP
jgi:hypothetical protein